MDKGLKIVDLIDGSHAARAGIKPGDILLSIDGKEINGLDDFVEVVNLRKEGLSSQVCVIERDGEEMTISMLVGPSGSSGSN